MSLRDRLPNGKKATPEEILDYVESLLKERPMSPMQLSKVLGKSSKQAQRYINALVQSNRATKIEGSNNYKATYSKANLNTVLEQRIIESKNEFDECESIKTWRKKNNSKDLETHISTMRNICMGVTLPDFKANPDFWMEPETTDNAITEIKKKWGLGKGDQIPKHLRHAIRNFLIFAKGVTLTEADADARGISGAKTKPKVSTLEMEYSQYIATKMMLKDDIIRFAKFVFRYWTFCRPSSMYVVRCDQLFFYDRVVKYIKVGDNKITDKNIIIALQDKYPVETYSHRACLINDLHEYKTDTPYTKHIWDDEAVKALESLCMQRITQGKKYLFWEDNSTEFTFTNYNKIAKREVVKDNTAFKAIFFQIGFKSGDFGASDRANYALRHFGVQAWLQMTDYNYGFVSEMGWEDMETLRQWYGKRTRTAMQKSLGEIVPFV